MVHLLSNPVEIEVVGNPVEIEVVKEGESGGSQGGAPSPSNPPFEIRTSRIDLKMNGIPESGVWQFGSLLSDVDMVREWGGRRTMTRQKPPVTDTNDLRVVAYTTNSEVRVAESFPVELRIENVTTNNVAIYVMKCSWFADWVTTEPLIHWEQWQCRGNYPELVAIAPGESYPMVLNVHVPARPPEGKLTFQLGFVQAGAASDPFLSVFWSNDITVTVPKSE
jgi:hypothetical protein